MVNEEFGVKLKKLKDKNIAKKRKKSNQYVKYILILIIGIGVSFGLYILYNNTNAKSIEEAQKFEESKKYAINTTIKMFSKYPNDPKKTVYISEITEAENSADIEKVMREASEYINFRNYKEDVINSIKETYGKYYDKSFYARTIVSKINGANSKDEINEIIKNSNIEDNAREYYLNDIKNQVSLGHNFKVEVGNTKKLMSRDEVLNYVNGLSLAELKSIVITPVSFAKITMTVNAIQCGNIPHSGDKIDIYSKDGSFLCSGIINSSYVILKDISYSESKSTSSSLDDNGDSNSVSGSSSISYSLSNIPGILHATAIDKLDYNKISKKFEKFGEKLNKIESNTQIFDDSVKYFLIISVPNDNVPEIIQMNTNDIVIVVKSKEE